MSRVPEYLQSFTMKAVKFPIDILFINGDQKIVKIAHNVQPGDSSVFSCEKTAAVLEVVGGYCKSHGIKAGDIIRVGMGKTAQAYCDVCGAGPEETGGMGAAHDDECRAILEKKDFPQEQSQGMPQESQELPREDGRREQMLRELMSDLNALVESGQMTSEQANEWYSEKADQWSSRGIWGSKKKAQVDPNSPMGRWQDKVPEVGETVGVPNGSGVVVGIDWGRTDGVYAAPYVRVQTEQGAKELFPLEVIQRSARKQAGPMSPVKPVMSSPEDDDGAKEAQPTLSQPQGTCSQCHQDASGGYQFPETGLLCPSCADEFVSGQGGMEQESARDRTNFTPGVGGCPQCKSTTFDPEIGMCLECGYDDQGGMEQQSQQSHDQLRSLTEV